MANGQAGSSTSTWSKQCSIPAVEITDSPIHRRIHKAASVGSISGLSEDSRSLEDGHASSSGSGKGDIGRQQQQQQQREELGEGVTSPSRKAADTLKKVRKLEILPDSSRNGW